MGVWGAIIMGFFGSLFAALTLAWETHLSGVALASPFLAFLALAGAAVVVMRRPGQGLSPSPATQKAITYASIGEGVGLFLAANIAANLHHPEWLLPSMALVVGLHFLPIAWAARFQPFYVLAAGLLLASALGFGFGLPAVSGFAAALALWLAALAAIMRDAKAKAASAG